MLGLRVGQNVTGWGIVFALTLKIGPRSCANPKMMNMVDCTEQFGF